ncbi:MAG: mannose-6-phosphate isomerase, class I [Candidatus Leucobacter sulfamidivorax]|nr:mannose-6-phosphate isomerase, class I [Candidatus Leucobacter sulfamidivorax]
MIFIENTPRAYAWGSRDALPELLGISRTGDPQAELWLGAHPDDPATVAKAAPKGQTLIDLIGRDPERYGVDGGQLPFLLKVLAIGAPLSLQVHPDRAQAEAGFAAEEAAGVPRDARERNYGDPNHKPELLVALSETTALSGFRPLGEARRDLAALAAAAPEGAGRSALERAVSCCGEDGEDPERSRREFMAWALGGGDEARRALAAIERIATGGSADPLPADVDPHRLDALRELAAAHPGDPGILVSLLLHLVRLEPGEAIYLCARQLHAYMSGIAVEVMAASDNVLRAGLTEKHVDVPELTRIVDPAELAEPRIAARALAPGLVAWEPEVPDFRLMRARLRDPGEGEPEQGRPFVRDDERADRVTVDAPYPIVLIVTSGRVRVERRDAELEEVASVRRGQSLYVSAGGAIELSGCGEAFLATVGEGWTGVSQPSSAT